MEIIASIDYYTGTDRTLIDRRFSVRAFVYNDMDEVAAIHSKKNDFYMLPGGGIKEGENKTEALKREVLEEIGTEINILCDLGQIEEYHDSKYHDNHMYHLTSYCFIGKQVGEIVPPVYSEKESVNEYEPVWIPFNQVQKLFKENTFRFSDREYAIAHQGLDTLANGHCKKLMHDFIEEMK